MASRTSTQDPLLERHRLLSASRAATLLDVSASTIRRWTQAGRLRAVRTPGRGARWRVRDLLDAVVEAPCQDSEGQAEGK